jgi:predicted O-methyltransferase YrrM
MDKFQKEQTSRYTVTEGHVSKEQIDYLRSILKRYTHIRNVLEIGFNGGHSSVAMLDARDDVSVTSFDIVSHTYVESAKEFVDELFPGRHNLVRGNSMNKLPGHTIRYDFAFVDGGHFEHVPESDIRNAIRLTDPGSLIVVDDYNYIDVAKACVVVHDEGLVRVHEGPIETRDRMWVTLEKVT